MKKGQYLGKCNRTACDSQNAIYYNHSTKEHYCPQCARTLNMYNPESQRLFGHELCTISPLFEPISFGPAFKVIRIDRGDIKNIYVTSSSECLTETTAFRAAQILNEKNKETCNWLYYEAVPQET